MRSRKNRKSKGLTVKEILERERLAEEGLLSADVSDADSDADRDSSYTQEDKIYSEADADPSYEEYDNEADEEYEEEYDDEADEEYDEEYDDEVDEEYEEEYDDEADEEYEEEYDDEADEEYEEEYDDEVDEEYEEEYDDEVDEEYEEEYDDEADAADAQPKKIKKAKKKKSKNKPAKKNKKKNIGNIVLAVAGAIILLCFAAYIIIAFGYYKNRFLQGTSINGADVSNISVEQYISQAENKASNYTLTVVNKDETLDTINGSDIGLAISDEGKAAAAKICADQNKIMWIKGFLGSRYDSSIDDLTVYNTDALDSIVMTSNGYNLPKTVSSESASLKYKDGKYQVTPPTKGDEIDKEVYMARVSEYVSALKDQFSIPDADVYVKVDSNDVNEEALNTACDNANRIIEGTNISIKMGESNEDITADVMNGILSLDENYNVKLDESTINAYVANLEKKYSNMGITRKFKTAHGTEVEVKGGDYGCSISTKTLAADINSAIFSKKPLNTTVALTRNVLSGTGADIGKTYIEVDLTNQYLYMYVDGKLVKQCPVVTGLPGVRATPQGTYMLKNKLMDVPLVGDTYVTPVKYWMPFNGGIGLHDAVWQRKFGGDYYKSQGSHGCVNLMMKDAGDIYKNAVVKMPVVCYYHNRIPTFQTVDSSGPVQGTYRALTSREIKMRSDLLSGKKINDSNVVRDSNVGQTSQGNNTTPAPTDTDENTNAEVSDDTAADQDTDSVDSGTGTNSADTGAADNSGNTAVGTDTGSSYADNGGGSNDAAADPGSADQNTGGNTVESTPPAVSPESTPPADTGGSDNVIKEIEIPPAESE